MAALDAAARRARPRAAGGAARIESFAADLGRSASLAGDPSAGLEAMDEALTAMQEARDAGDVPGLVGADMAFHRAPCETTGNVRSSS